MLPATNTAAVGTEIMAATDAATEISGDHHHLTMRYNIWQSYQKRFNHNGLHAEAESVNTMIAEKSDTIAESAEAGFVSPLFFDLPTLSSSVTLIDTSSGTFIKGSLNPPEPIVAAAFTPEYIKVEAMLITLCCLIVLAALTIECHDDLPPNCLTALRLHAACGLRPAVVG